MRWLILAALASTVAPLRAAANAPEDMFGASARVGAMGGAGTAVARDASAAYYNPASLARCPDSNISFDTHRISYGLDTERVGADAPPGSQQALPAQTRVGMGACLLLPYHLAMGAHVDMGLEHLATIRMDTSSSRPNFPLYGQQLEHLNVNAGFAYRPVRQIAIGAGASVLVDTNLTIAVYLPLADLNSRGNFNDLGFRIDARVTPRLAPYFGVLIEPTPRIRIGLSYRGKIAMNLQEPISITAAFLGFTVPVPMNLSSSVWYSPRQLAIGVAGDITPNLMVTGDLTHYGYSDLRDSSFPYVDVGDIPGSAGSILGIVGLAPTDPPDYRDVWALRTGVEGRVGGNRHLALRGGYAVRSSALPHSGSRNTTLLDGAVHSFSVGAGIAIHNTWDDSADSHDTFSRSHDDRGEEPELEGDADAATIAAARQAARNSERERARTLRLAARIDGFMRLSLMPTQSDSVKDLHWGGTMLDMGVTLSLGWR